jgi:hypothetical protein
MLSSRRAPSCALLVPLVSVAAWAASCSADGGFQAGSASAGSGQGGSDLIIDGGVGGGLPDPGAACGLITEQARATPLSLYITLDKSSSMAGNKWDSAKAGLNAFVNDPSSTGIKVALNFFPLNNNPTCDQYEYKTPVVAFAPLPQNALPVTQAMAVTMPDGFLTPIYPALGGAILAAKEQADNHPGEAASVLLVTDGDPQGPSGTCSGVDPMSPQAIADLAKAGTMIGIKTFVIGLPGAKQTTVNLIAQAGGTGAAILVGSFNVQAEFQDALAAVRGQAVHCAYELPEKVAGGEIDVGLVNVLLTPGGGKTAILPQSPTCSGDGWKYDDPMSPKHIELCPSSCTSLKTDYSAKVQILLGCKTEVAR